MIKYINTLIYYNTNTNYITVYINIKNKEITNKIIIYRLKLEKTP
jgi:hypothetical protein